MTLNTSSKICISKRLTITMLLLIMVGFSVVVFSTLSSSVNKTTSSKAEAPESVALKDIGGKNQPCFVDRNKNALTCNKDTGLLCSASLDFWLTKDDKRDSYKDTKCIDYADIPMGSKGNLCRKEGLGVRQCDSGLVCAQVIKAHDGGTIGGTQALQDYLELTYKGTKRTDLIFEMGPDGKMNKIEVIALLNGITHFTYSNANNTNPFLVDPPSICIPENLSKVESCGDAGQKACKNELGQSFCFGDYFPNPTNNICNPKQIIKNKGLVRCDNGSLSCNDFCASNNAKCVETCEDKILVTWGDESKEMIVQAGLFEQEQIKGVTQSKKSGTCNQKEAPSYISNGNQFSFSDVCSRVFNTYCCCDKK